VAGQEPRARTLAELQRQLDAFRAYYNHHRPHRALRGATPAERFAAKAKAQPSGIPIDLPRPPTLRIGERTVQPNGVITTGGKLINLGTSWAGRTLTVITYGTRVAILNGTTLVRALQLDPNRRYHPLLLPKS
jgi:hypothetical protein